MHGIDKKLYSSFNSELEEIWTSFEINNLWSPFQSYAWLYHWQKYIGESLHNIQPLILVLRDSKKVLGILPMALRRKKGIRILEWLGGIHSDYAGPILHPDFHKTIPDFYVVWNEIKKLLPPFDVIHFRRQPQVLGGIMNPFVSDFSVLHNDNAYQADLTGNWEEFYSGRIKKKIRADSRRQLQRLNEKGVVQFKIADSLSEVDDIIQNMIVQKSQRYRDTGVTDMLAVKEHIEFYKGLAYQSFNQSKLHCSALMVDGLMIATHLGLVCNNIFFYLMPAHHSGYWQRYSPGRLLLENLLEWSFNEGIEVFDFTVGAEQYKKDWCELETKLFEYIQPMNYKGDLYFLVQKLIKKLFQHKALWNLLKKVNSLRFAPAKK